MHIKIKEFDADMLQNAISVESKRVSSKKCKNPKPISQKRLKNEYGLIRAVLKKYRKDIFWEDITLPKVSERIPVLIHPEDILIAIQGTDIELAALLAMWLSFSQSEIKGLTKSNSIDGDYLTIKEVVVTGYKGVVKKDLGKNRYRNRTHRIPPYIKSLIDAVDGDVLVPYSSSTIWKKWTKVLEDNHLPHITFHDLRHVSASVMALLRVPDKYAQERGGWKSDKVMKRVYTQTFSEERINVDNMIDEYFDKKIEKNNR